VGEDPHFERRGKDVYTVAHIDVGRALLGGKIFVRTLDGKVSLKIPPGTKGRTVLRMKNLGVQQNGVRGDQYVTIDVEIPKDLTAEEKELVKKLARSRGWNT
jgi:curved DNA-binding protein